MTKSKLFIIPVQLPVRRQFVYSPRDRPPADLMNIVLSFLFFLTLARHLYIFEGDIFLDTQKEGWKNLVNSLYCPILHYWRFGAAPYIPTLIKVIERGTYGELVNGDKTQIEMAELWTEKISGRTISRALKKIGFTRKKKPTVIKKEMK